jgi:hypothetical protein
MWHRLGMEIPARFNGPPGSGNGGWSSGAFALATGLGGTLEVTLRVPPPLDTPLKQHGSSFAAPDGTLVASVAATDDPGEPVPPVSWDEAEAASTGYPGFTDHPFPTCYVCGPERPDGLRLFPGFLPDCRAAAPWIVPSDVVIETVWAALDCPGGWSTALSTERPYVLGRMAATVAAVPSPGARCVVVGRKHHAEGRKAFTTSTVYGPDGTRLATARATWIRLRQVR